MKDGEVGLSDNLDDEGGMGQARRGRQSIQIKRGRCPNNGFGVIPRHPQRQSLWRRSPE